MKLTVERSTELLLWIVAALCFGTVTAGLTFAVQAQHAAKQLLSAGEGPKGKVDVRTNAASSSVSAVDHVGANGSEVIGQIRIRALGLSVPITAGVESTSLLKGVGHIDGTAFPGGLGTLALAGHRDTYLRPLEHIRTGMDVEVMNRAGTYHYKVDSSEIVMPEQVDVLSIRARPELVLITCYPFHYIGAAPQRFIVHAHLVSLAPDPPELKDAGSHGGN